MLCAMEARSCGSCGLPVAVGYARCPRCRAALDAPPVAGGEPGRVEAPRARRVSSPPGGTAVAAPTMRSRWLLAGFAVAAGAGVAAAVLVASGGRSAPSSSPAAAEPAGDTAALVVAAAPAPAAPGGPSAEEGPALPQGAAAIAGLRRAMGKARVYAQLAPDGDRLELRSSSCEDARLSALLEEAKAPLQQSGFRRVRCLQPHGQVVFERDL